MNIQIKEVERTNSNRHKFRQLARIVSGEVFDIPESNGALFAYNILKHKDELVGVISFQTGSATVNEPGASFDSEFFNVITFLFVHRDFQGAGIGRKLVNMAIDIMVSSINRPVRVESAFRAVDFFIKLGFVQKKEPMDCFGGGPKLFKTIVGMERAVT